MFWLLATVAGLATVVGFNVLVDPYGAYPGLHLRRFDRLRYLDIDRVAKAEMARKGDWQVIILGSSRSQAGLPATYPFLATNRTCNLSMDGARFPELASAFDYALRHNPLEHVLLCVNLEMFFAGPDWVLEFPESRFNPGFDRFGYYCRQLLGRDSSGRAWATLRRRRQGYNPPPQSRNGFYHHHLNADTRQRELFDRVLRATDGSYLRRRLNPAYLELFRQMVRTCRDRHVDLQIAIMPVHALGQELVYANGCWHQLEQWETCLVNVLANEGVEGRFNLWDFSGYAGPPAEPIPPAGDARTRMRFFFENSHCTPLLGGMMLDAMFGHSETNTFGIKLTRSNIQAHLARMLADRAVYARTNAADIRWVQGIVAKLSALPSERRH